MSEIRVLIADDHAILREGIRSLLERQPDIEVVAEASNGREALERTLEFLPDIVLLDITMPEMNGLEATYQIKRFCPDARVIILTQHDNREYIAPLLQAGASGYVLKRSGGKEVLMAIREVYTQGAFLEPSVARQLINSYNDSDRRDGETVPHLTEREFQVLQMVVEGKSNKEIAFLLNISPKTVSVHRSNLMSKLDVHNTVELVHYANQHNLFSLDINSQNAGFTPVFDDSKANREEN